MRAALLQMSSSDFAASELAAEPVEQILTAAPGDGNPLGGVKVIAKSGWFAVRPSGTEDVYKIYAETFRDRDHLRQIQEEARAMVERVTGKAGAGTQKT